MHLRYMGVIQFAFHDFLLLLNGFIQDNFCYWQINYNASTSFNLKIKPSMIQL